MLVFKVTIDTFSLAPSEALADLKMTVTMGRGTRQPALNWGLLQAYKPNHQQLEDQHRDNDLVKGLPPYLHIRKTLNILSAN